MFGSLLSAGANLIGGLLGNKKAEDVKDANFAMSAADRQLQEDFAKQGIRWRVEDARAAGISPLAAMGANLSSPSPTAIGLQHDNSLGDAIGRAGQDLSRAFDSTRTQKERDSTLYNLQLDRARLQNEFLRSQIAASKVAITKQAGGNPAFPGQENVFDERTLSRSGDLSTTASAPKSAVTEFINKDGSVILWPSKDAKEAVEDNVVYEGEHIARNRVFPWFEDNVSRPIRRIFEKVYVEPYERRTGRRSDYRY